MQHLPIFVLHRGKNLICFVPTGSKKKIKIAFWTRSGKKIHFYKKQVLKPLE
jgi:hypothetical protein